MVEATKKQRRELRTLATVAYERELAGELEKVEEAFEEWRAGRINAFDLEQRIHEFHNGPARSLYKLYEADADPRMVVGRAMLRGLLDSSELGSELLCVVEPIVDLLRKA